ncbi:unnamed protein product [Linum trigynum]|uniref:Uncharacterized protein n=1 Tax=Linum trigynum TaxID=586398 RepID=A0AAV2CF38_9ROSI
MLPLAPDASLKVWEEVVEWCSNACRGRGCKAVAGRAIWSLAVSLVWRERCSRVYGEVSIRAPEDISRELYRILYWRAEVDSSLQESPPLGCLSLLKF